MHFHVSSHVPMIKPSIFTILNKREKFEWIKEYEESSLRLKTFLPTPMILKSPERMHAFLNLLQNNDAINFLLIWELDGNEKPIYFVRTAFKRVELQYQEKVNFRSSYNDEETEAIFPRAYNCS